MTASGDWRVQLAKILARAFAVWLFAASVEILLHDSQMLFWLTQQAYFFLQANIPLERRAEFPIVVLDLSRLRSTTELTPITNVPGLFVRASTEYTHRPALTEIVKRLASFGPACIGVDIDFSPLTPSEGSDGSPPPGHLAFLDACKELRTPAGYPIPVYLGVMRTAHLAPEAWLDSSEHQQLAASIARFRGRNSHVPYEIQRTDGGQVLPTMSKVCSDAWLMSQNLQSRKPPGWLAQIARAKRTEKISGAGEGNWITSFPVDYYSTLPTIESSRLYAEELFDAPSVRTTKLLKQIYGKIVLIGYATRSESYDTVSIPGEPDPVPGVYVHACAAATLAVKPLYEVKPLAGYSLSLFFSLAIATSVFKWKQMHSGRQISLVALEGLMTLVAVGVSLAISLAFVRWAGVLWLEVTSLWLFLGVEFGLGLMAPGGEKH